MAGKQVELTVREYIQLLRKNNIRVDRAILFGSYASGKAREDSDIDVAIISPDLGRDRIEETVVLKKLAEQVDYDLSPRPYSLDQYRNAKRGDFLHDEIIRRGKAI
ncbi:nucleotidyltransferase domain-containing protein [Moorella naiadis]|uniref:nucleotidyltransferase domain-containing protein n=1 Tax=Moorella naiadis (nom. illeg.) TaxID=3093670 RepID=UPI003D9CA251